MLVRGGRYDPQTDTWTELDEPSAPLRADTSVTWTGRELIRWGGDQRPNLRTCTALDGARYDPTSDAWTPSSTDGAPLQQFGHRALWTGGELWVWGGWCGETFYGDRAAYDPAADTWRPLPPDFIGRFEPTLWGYSIVWDGHEAIYWGGLYVPRAMTNRGARYRASNLLVP
jgi:hypothetical protein